MYQTIKLTMPPQKIDNPYTRTLRVVHGTIPEAIPFPAWGVDPGVNFGLTVIEDDKVLVFHGILNKDEKPGCYGLIAYQFLQSIIRQFYRPQKPMALMVIEGASYGSQFGQVLLSEVRTGFYLAAASNPGFSDVVIRPPKEIRKAVFGDGTIRAPDEFPTLNHNAADSLAMALYASQYEGDE